MTECVGVLMQDRLIREVRSGTADQQAIPALDTWRADPSARRFSYDMATRI